MDVEYLLAICFSIYRLAKDAKTNKELCRQLAKKVKGVEELVLTIKVKKPGRVSRDVEKPLKMLYSNLKMAEDLMTKYSQAKGLKSFQNHKEKFDKINEELTSNFELLSGALQKENMDMLRDMYETISQRAPKLRPDIRSHSFPAPTASTHESYMMPPSTPASPTTFSYMMAPNQVIVPTAPNLAPYMFPPPVHATAPQPVPAMAMPVPMQSRATVYFPPAPTITMMSSFDCSYN